MKVGDKKQVTILAFVAVAALIFLVTQLGSTVKASAVPRLLAAISGSQIPSQQGELEAGFPEIVTRDAFSHPKLELAAAKSGQRYTVPTDKVPRFKGPNDRVVSTLGTLPTDPGLFQASPDLNQKPAEITRGTEKENEAPGVSIKLLATLRASEWRAVVQVGSGDSLVVSQGQTLAEGIEIRKIGEEGISLRHGGKTSVLAVGGEMKL